MLAAMLVSAVLSLTQAPPVGAAAEVAKLLPILEKGTPAQRLQALRQLAELGPDAKAATPALIKALRDPDETIRRRASATLLAIGPKEIKWLEPLTAALRGDDDEVQGNIGALLTGIGPIATTKLIALLHDDDPVARRGAALALEPFGVDAAPAVKTLVKTLTDKDAAVRLAAARALVKIEPTEQASYPVLAEGLAQVTGRRRLQLVMVLADSGRPALAAPLLLKLLASKDAAARHDAVLGLRKLGGGAVPVLLEGLRHANVEVRRDAANGLFDVVQAARRERDRVGDDQDPAPAEAKLKAVLDALGSARPNLTKMLQDADLDLRLTIAKTLYQATGDLEQALGPFGAALGDKDANVRKAAIVALRGVPDKSERLRTMLLTAAKDPSIDVKLEALTALWLNHGDSEAAQHALVDALRDKAIRQNAHAMVNRLIGQGHDLTAVILPLIKHADPDLRAHGAALLRKPGVADETVRAALVGLLKDKDGAVRLQALKSLTAGAEFPEEIVPPIAKMLEDAEREIRIETAAALRRFGDHARLVVPALIVALRDRADFVRSAAADSLAHFKDDGPLVVAGLVKALRDEDDDYVKERLVRALALFGAEAKEAVPLLLDLIKADPTFSMAIAALGRIGPDAKAAAPVLTEALRKDGGNKNLHDALAGIGPDAAPLVIQLLDDPKAATRQGAAIVLGKIGVGARAEDALEKRLKDDDPGVRIAAGLAHFQVSGQTKSALATLIGHAKQGDRRHRLQALRALKEMGPEARDAVPTLVMHLGDGDKLIRAQAEDALRVIDPEALERARAAM